MRTVFFCVHVINYESNARDYFMTKVNCKQPWLVARGVGGPVTSGPGAGRRAERRTTPYADTRRRSDAPTQGTPWPLASKQHAHVTRHSSSSARTLHVQSRTPVRYTHPAPLSLASSLSLYLSHTHTLSLSLSLSLARSLAQPSNPLSRSMGCDCRAHISISCRARLGSVTRS